MNEGMQRRLKTQPRAWLVTGAADFIGSHRSGVLRKPDQRAVGLANAASRHRDHPAPVKDALGQTRHRRFRFIGADMRSRAACRDTCRPAPVDPTCSAAPRERIALHRLFESIGSLRALHCSRLRNIGPVCRELRPGDIRLSQADTARARDLSGCLPMQTAHDGAVCALDRYLSKCAPQCPVDNENARPPAASPAPEFRLVARVPNTRRRVPAHAGSVTPDPGRFASE